MAEAYGATPTRSLQGSAARRAWETTVLAHLSGARETPGLPVSLAHAAALFIEDMLHAGYHLTTARRWWYYLKVFLEWCAGQGVEHLAQVEPEVVRRFLGHLRWERKLGRRSLHGYFAKLFFFLRHFTERGMLSSHPMQGMRIRQGTGRPAQRLLSEAEIRSLFRAVSNHLQALPANYPGLRFVAQRDQVLLELMLASGLRASEIASLRVGDVDLQRGSLSVTGKGSTRFFKRNRTAFFDVEPLRTHLREYLAVRGGDPAAPLFPSHQDGGVLTPGSLDVLVKRWAARAGISRRVHCHMFRYTFCTHLISHGADVFSAQRLMGHWAVETTLAYYLHLTPGEIRDDWQQHNPLRGREVSTCP